MKLEEYYIPEYKADIIEEMVFKCDSIYEAGDCDKKCNDCIFDSTAEQAVIDYTKWTRPSTT